MIRYTGYEDQYKSELVELWNSTLVYDTTTDEIFEKDFTSDPNFDNELFLLAFDEDVLCGFIFAIKRKVPYLSRGLEPDKGWIMCMGVKDSHRRRGIGSQLVNKVMENFLESSISSINLCSFSPIYITPGIDKKYSGADKFFEKMGFSLGNIAVSMKRDLYNYTMEKPYVDKIENLQKNGYEFRMVEERDYDSLLTFCESEFGGGWTLAIQKLIDNTEANNCIVIGLKNQEIVGFCVRKMDGNDCRYGPVGVSSKLRGSGLGGILTEKMFESMKKQKIYTTYFLWTTGKNIDFYKKHGFEIYREYIMGGYRHE